MELSVKRGGWLAFVLILTGCSKTLDRDRIAQSIQRDVIQQGGVSLKMVSCPKNIPQEAEQTFECIGETDAGYTFTIPVKQQNAEGSVLWDIPNAKGLLNLAKLEMLVQEGVQSEIGSRPIIRCSGTYKAVKPGETFECAVDVKAQPPKKPKLAKLNAIPLKPKPDRILVTIDTDRNVNWQRVLPGALLNPTPDQASAAVSTATPTVTNQPTAATKPAPSAKSNAEDFLNQPGAADEF